MLRETLTTETFSSKKDSVAGVLIVAGVLVLEFQLPVKICGRQPLKNLR